MHVVTIHPDNSARWEAYVNRCDQTTPGQSYDWYHMLRRHYGFELHALAAEEGGEIVGVLPLYQLKNGGGPSRLISSPYAVNGGLTADSPKAARALFDAAVELSQRLNAPGITFKQYRWPVEFEVTTDANWRNRELDLSLTQEEMWAKLDARNRAGIEAASQRGLTLELNSQRVDEFYQLLLRFMTRSGTPCCSRAWIDSLLQLDLQEMAMVLKDGRPIAATLVKPFKWMVSFPFTCLANDREETLDAAFLLYWELIRKYAQKKFRVFHSGRMPQNEDVPLYRRGWGGTPHVYYYHYYPATATTTESGSKRGLKRRLVTKAWKYLPLSVAAKLGPKVVAKFP